MRIVRIITLGMLLAALGVSDAVAQDAASPALPAKPAAQPADTPRPTGDLVRLRNGNTLDGTVKSADAKALTFTHALGGDLIVPWPNIASLETRGLQIVRLKNGDIYHGVLERAGGVGDLSMVMPNGGRIDRIDIGDIDGFGPPPPIVDWEGSVAIGTSVESGNSDESSFNASIYAQRKSVFDLIEAAANYGYGEAGGEVDTRNGAARVQYNYRVWDPGYVYVRANLEYDRFAFLNMRSRGGGGAGVHVLEEVVYDWRVEVGVEYVNEDNRDSPDIRYTAIRFGTIFRWQPVKWFRFRQYLEYLPDVNDWSDFNARSESNLNIDAGGGFGFALSVIVDYDETPPAGAKHRADTTYNATLTYTF